jgi:hypothetical protein
MHDFAILKKKHDFFGKFVNKKFVFKDGTTGFWVGRKRKFIVKVSFLPVCPFLYCS